MKTRELIVSFAAAGLLAGSLVGTAAASHESNAYDPLSSISAPKPGTPTASLTATYDPLSSIQVSGSLPLIMAGPVEFSGRWGYGEPITPEASETLGGITRNRGGIWATTVSGTSDPRLDGQLLSAASMDIYPSFREDGQPVFAFNEVIRIENERGAWQALPHVGFFSPGFSPDDVMADWTIVLTGEGAYAGLTAVAWLDGHRSDDANWIDVRGFILPSSHPSQPADVTELAMTATQ